MQKMHRYNSWTKYFWIIMVLLTVFFLPYLQWYLKPVRLMHAVILDKTVPVSNYREHQGLMWLFNNLKYYNKDTGAPFRKDQDYYGFFPLDAKSYDIKELPTEIGQVDLVYITDTYGVYSDDFYTDNLRGNRSELIYGGISQEEIKRIRSTLNKQNVLVAEFNSFGTPTEAPARNDLEDLLGVKWMGWIGRYFPDLSRENSEIPTWLIRNYEHQYQTKWNFSGSGFAFVKNDDTVIILREGQEVGNQLQRLIFTQAAKSEFSVQDGVSYYYWFDVVQPVDQTEVLASFVLDTTDEGKKVLQKFGLSNTFPAVLRKNSSYLSYYFAGDFSDNQQIPGNWQKGYQKFWHQFLTADMPGNQSYFYWNVYFPMMEQIIGGVNYEQR